MITKNFKNILLASLCDRTSYINLLHTNNSTTSYSPADLTAIFTPASMGTDVYVRVGNNATEVTENDYTINEVSGVTYNSFTLTKQITASHRNAKLSYVAVMTNSSSSNLVINEIGLFIKKETAVSTTRFLLYRETFEPITLAPGETRTFSIVLS